VIISLSPFMEIFFVLYHINHYAVMPAQLQHPLNRNLVLEDYLFHCLI
jgi:hypothetical protein